VNWSAAFDNGGSLITGYTLQMDNGTSGAPLNQIYNGSYLPSTLSYNATGLSVGKSYTFTVTSINAVGTSTTAGVTIVASTLPYAPIQPNQVLVSSTKVSLYVNWSAPTYNGGSAVTGYELFMDNGVGGALVSTFGGNGTLATQYNATGITGLITGATYRFAVRAWTYNGYGPLSALSYLVCAIAPAAPTQVPVATAYSGKQFIVTWTYPTDSGGSVITGYQLFMNNNSDTNFKLVYNGTGAPSTFTATVTQSTDSRINTGSNHQFIVRALNYVGFGAYSGSSVTAITLV